MLPQMRQSGVGPGISERKAITLLLATQILQQESARLQRSEDLKRLDPAAKARADAEAWRGWLRRYRARLQQEADAGADACRRIATMNGINPRSGRQPHFNVQ